MRQQTHIPNGSLEEVIEFKGAVYAFGHELEGSAGIGPGTIWRSPDGTSWTQAAVLEEARGDWMDVIVTGTRLLALSASAVTGERAWLSSDGAEWRTPKGGSPDRWYGAALGNTVVLAGNVYGTHVGLAAKVSTDAGETWQDVSTEADYEFQPSFAVSNDTLLVAMRACCSLPGVDVGIPLTTRDGFNWVAAEPQLSPADAAVAVPGGFLMLSNGGSTALSVDGEVWFAGPRMSTPGEYGRYLGAATAGPTGVLVTSSEYRNAMEYDVRLWFAPVEAFDFSEWTAPVPLADQPKAGTPYPASIDVCPYSIRMAGQVWMPSTEISLEQPPWDEDATVTLIDAEHAIYTRDDGQTVPLEPVHPVPPDPDPGC